MFSEVWVVEVEWWKRIRHSSTRTRNNKYFFFLSILENHTKAHFNCILVNCIYRQWFLTFSRPNFVLFFHMKYNFCRVMETSGKPSNRILTVFPPWPNHRTLNQKSIIFFSFANELKVKWQLRTANNYLCLICVQLIR